MLVRIQLNIFSALQVQAFELPPYSFIKDLMESLDELLVFCMLVFGG